MKPGNEFVDFKGKALWVRAVVPDKYGFWSLVLYPDTATLDKIRELQAEGVKNVLKKDEEGYYIRIKRPVSKETRDGRTLSFTPPKCFEADGKTPTDGTKIGNGSDLSIKMDVYVHGTPSGGKAKAMRMDSIRVDNLVPFNPDTDYTPDEKEVVDRAQDMPKPVWG